MLRRARTLNTAKNMALICASIAVTTSSAFDIYSRLHPAAAAVAPTPVTPRPATTAFRTGAKAPALAGVDYARADRTLVLFLSTHCKYCEMSVPFYRDLAAKLANGANGNRKRLVAVFPQTADEISQYKQREKLAIETVADASLNDLGIAGTPTLLLVAADGTVLRSWVGAPQEKVKDAILSAFLQG